MRLYDKQYIDGAWTASAGTEMLDVVNPTTEEVIGRVPAGAPTDIDAAVAAARAAFPGWSQTPVAERAELLAAIAAKLEERQEELGRLIAQEVGMPLKLATIIQAGNPLFTFKKMPQILAETEFEEQVGNSLVVKEPVGVVGAITPWNYPLHQIAAKVAPALGAGCTVVLKPSEIKPLSAFVLAEIMDEVGVPAGVFNLVCGAGPVVGQRLAEHPDVDMISFTGSTRAGKAVSRAAAGNVKRVTLELGGKSPNVILDDLEGEDLWKAVRAGVNNCFLNTGQTCSALSRMIVPREKLGEVEELAAKAAEFFALGDPLEKGTRLGPVVSQAQRERVRGYIEKGREEGARLVTGGAEAPEGMESGYFVKPTIFSDVSNEMTIAREEIFGPVLSIIPYDSEEEAVKIANDTVYGLAGAVWSADEERARRVAHRLRTGQVDINGGRFNMLAPFGGYKQSGHGRELGKYGLEEFLILKSLQL
jgi:acyl-CoA reductase-like NAD-dependent aldehyde dehydrogenase